MAKIINYKIRNLAEIDRHEEFVAAVKFAYLVIYYLWSQVTFSLSLNSTTADFTPRSS